MQDNALTIEQILTRFVIYFEPFYKKLYPVLNTILLIHQKRTGNYAVQNNLKIYCIRIQPLFYVVSRCICIDESGREFFW